MVTKRHALVLSVYTVLAVVMTWPLAMNFGAALPGIGGDSSSFVWALGWAKTALVDLHVSPFRTDYAFYPLGGATQLLWAVSLVGLVSIPLQVLFGLVAAHNLLYLAATVLTAYGTFLLADEVLWHTPSAEGSPAEAGALPPFQTLLMVQFVATMRQRLRRRSALAPFTAGLVFAFAPLRLGYGLAFLNLYNTELIPFYLLFLLRVTRTRARRDAWIAGIFLGLNAYIDFQIAAFLILLTAVYALYALIARGRLTDLGKWWVALRTLLPLWSVVGVASLVLAIPILLAVAEDFSIEGGNYIQVYKLEYSADRSYDLLSFFLPNARSSLYSDFPLKVVGVNSAAKAEDETPLSPDRQAFVGYIILALAGYAVVRRWRQARLWLLIAVLFALFSLGPFLHLFGRETDISLPYLVLHEIPIINHIRIPMRYGILVYLALAMLVAIAIERIRTPQAPPDASQMLFNPMGVGLTRRLIIARLFVWLIPIGILAEYAVLPFPVQPFSVPSVYDQIARVPGDFTVLEIPSVYWRGAAATEVFQAFHDKRILRAYTNRIAPDLAEYFGLRGTPIVTRSMRALEGLEPAGLTSAEMEEDQGVRDQVLAFFNLRYAVLHRDLLKSVEARNIESYLRQVMGARVIADDGVVVGYELPVPQLSSFSIAIDLREAIGQMYAGRGWQFEYPPANWQREFNFVWTRGTRSEIYFAAPHPADGELRLNAYAAVPQTVGVVLNQYKIGQLELTPEWKDYALAFPAQWVHKGMNRVELVFSGDYAETVGVTTIRIKEVEHGAQAGR